MPLEQPPYEAPPSTTTPQEAYEQNHAALLGLMGRINGLLSAKYRAERPREWEHIGQQEEVISMLQSTADYLSA